MVTFAPPPFSPEFPFDGDGEQGTGVGILTTAQVTALCRILSATIHQAGFYCALSQSEKCLSTNARS
jgi:hypothetical protein